MIKRSATSMRFTQPPDAGPAIQLASMVDIVLLLICFYLFVAKSVTEADDLAVSLPVVASEATGVQRPGTMVVNVRADGAVLIDGQPTPRETLAEALAGRLSLSDDNRSVVVRIDRARPFGDLHWVQEACRAANADVVVLRTVEQD